MLDKILEWFSEEELLIADGFDGIFYDFKQLIFGFLA